MQRKIRLGAAAAVALAVCLTAGCDGGSGGAASPSPSSATPPPSATSAAPSPSEASPTRGPGKPAQSPSIAPTVKPDPAAGAMLSRGDRGEKVRELQHRLRQLEWYAGPISGRYATSTVRAVEGFQDKRDLGTTGRVDRATWTALVKRTRTPTRDERHDVLKPGPAILESGDTGDRVRDLQARLKQLAWFSGDVTGTYGTATASAVRGFQGKRAIPVTGEVDRRTLDRLTAMTRTPTRAEKHNRVPKPSAAGLDPRCLTGRALCVSKSSNSLTWVVDGRPQLRVDVRFGSTRTPTRDGAFSVGWKSRDHVSTLYDTPMPYAMFFSGGQAVHYSADFAANGYSGASHGCVNVRNLPAIKSLFNQVQVGDKVVVHR